MLVINHNEKACCTCSHWMGMRVAEDRGYVYSLENLEGTCKNGNGSPTRQVEANYHVTFPNASCTAWERWPSAAP